jgi:hypothetical protein
MYIHRLFCAICIMEMIGQSAIRYIFVLYIQQGVKSFNIVKAYSLAIYYYKLLSFECRFVWKSCREISSELKQILRIKMHC